MKKIEMETTINFNEAEQMAEVYVHNRKLKNRLAKLAEEFPQVYQKIDEGTDGTVTYRIPKNLITIRRPYPEARREENRRRDMESLRRRQTGNVTHSTDADPLQARPSSAKEEMALESGGTAPEERESMEDRQSSDSVATVGSAWNLKLG